MPAQIKPVNLLKVKITLKGIKPPVWRRILIADTSSLAALHEAIQATMGWTGYHLYHFEVQGEYFSNPTMLDRTKNDSKIKLSRLIRDGIRRFEYTYDFGDNWEHTIVIEGAEISFPENLCPMCIAGKRACPPEDCGSIWGYYELLEILSDQNHPERDERLEWLGRDYDPDAFDLVAANKALSARFTAAGKRRPNVARWVMEQG